LRSSPLVEGHDNNLFKICSLHHIEVAHKSGRHVNYISDGARKKFGPKGACRAVVNHWSELFQIARLILSLCGARGSCKVFAFIKLLLFCNYLMASHLAHYFFGRKLA
jgi:hypothetical protein